MEVCGGDEELPPLLPCILASLSNLLEEQEQQCRAVRQRGSEAYHPPSLLKTPGCGGVPAASYCLALQGRCLAGFGIK
ncbi:hypothetical protein E2C01_039608 [Portunus trituberculatus]|uniref:Uncharacterized protein n=1 Tax=Portunus trituberculatus TaxID=210409 RepID=A0A5B7FHA3_PORTR|nr:hypothetical protein [Portunus trituberculatus]